MSDIEKLHNLRPGERHIYYTGDLMHDLSGRGLEKEKAIRKELMISISPGVSN